MIAFGDVILCNKITHHIRPFGPPSPQGEGLGWCEPVPLNNNLLLTYGLNSLHHMVSGH